MSPLSLCVSSATCIRMDGLTGTYFTYCIRAVRHFSCLTISAWLLGALLVASKSHWGELFIMRSEYATVSDTARFWVLSNNPCSAPRKVWPLLVVTEGVKAKITAQGLKAMTRVTKQRRSALGGTPQRIE